MEVIFIRHGHGEHLLDYPNQLNMFHPGLTEYGRMQVNQLGERLEFSSDDLILVSPTKRTIETAQLLSNNNNFVVSPLVGPRMFPQNPEFPFLNCDQIYSKVEVATYNKNLTILDFGLDCWGEGINRIEQEKFEKYSKQLLEWCQERYTRLIIISHDGTITNYRIIFGEQGLTRKDFLGEARIYKTNV
jgi:broad specificity phosphatase PhoE